VRIDSKKIYKKIDTLSWCIIFVKTESSGYQKKLWYPANSGKNLKCSCITSKHYEYPIQRLKTVILESKFNIAQVEHSPAEIVNKIFSVNRDYVIQLNFPSTRQGHCFASKHIFTSLSSFFFFILFLSLLISLHLKNKFTIFRSSKTFKHQHYQKQASICLLPCTGLYSNNAFTPKSYLTKEASLKKVKVL
jgi:hypothetical protein